MESLLLRGARLTGVAASSNAEVVSTRSNQCRHMAKVAFPVQPYHKAQIKAKRPIRNVKNKWYTFNDPGLTAKFLRHAERVARDLGVADELKEFDEAAKSFPNAPPLIASTILERANVVMRDVEQWEGDFLAMKFDREQAVAKPYPDALIDMWTAGDKVMETERAADGVPKAKGKPAGKDAKPAAEGGAVAQGGESKQELSASLASGPVGLADFYEKSGAEGNNSTESGTQGLAIASRESSADTIGDMRSLERAYAQRLALVVRDRATGTWSLPAGECLEGEGMKQAAERVLRATFGDPSLLLYYPGNAPVGHWLRVYSPEEQQAKQCYGEKIFFYRADIGRGRFRLPREGEAGFRSPATFPYDDFRWLTRDEMEGVMTGGSRPLWKYLHQVVGLGAGEEYARAQAWKSKVAGQRGGSIQAGTAVRVHRVSKQKRLGYRLPAIATRKHAELAAAPWDKEGVKEAAWADLSRTWWQRRKEGRARGVALRQDLATPSQQTLLTARMAAARAALGTGKQQPALMA